MLKNRLVRINLLILLNLGVGFSVSVLVPRMAIERLGAEAYGLYALIVGFAAVLAFADLGLLPGLIRSLAGPLVQKQKNVVTRTLARVFVMTVILWCILLLVCGVVIWSSIAEKSLEVYHAFGLFAAASLLTLWAELSSGLIRVTGCVEYTYVLRIGYLFLFLFIVFLLYFFSSHWSGIWILCAAQLAATIPYAYFMLRRLTSILNSDCDGKGVSFERGNVDIRVIWSETWRVSNPERFNRVIQLIAGALERPLMLATSGSLLVASYDLLIRLGQIISAVPSALSQPLQAMIAHDLFKSHGERRFGNVVAFTRKIGIILSFLGFFISYILWQYFHEFLFATSSHLPVWLAITVMFATAINVITAPGVAVCLAHGNPAPVQFKMFFEFFGVLMGIAIALWFESGVAFIAIRNIAIGLSALIFLILENRCHTHD